MLHKKIKVLNFSSLSLIIVGILFLLTCLNICSFNHFDPWTSSKLYPSFALSNLVDLYNITEAPYILTVYGPLSSLFYLPATLGKDPETCFWIGLSLNVIALILFCLVVFGFFFKQNSKLTITAALSFLFFLTIEKTTISVFQIHHDLPCIFYYTLFILFLVILKNKITFVTLSFLFLWFAVWTKITTLPWLLLPIIFKIFFPKSIKSLNNLSITKIILIHFSCGVTIFILMGFCYGFKDLHFHLIEATNSYPWRECNDLWGVKDHSLSTNDFSSKVLLLLKILFHYAKEYWWLLISCTSLLLNQIFSSQRNTLIICFTISYFLTLPTCLSALAKFGGVENSLLFAHFSGFASLFLFSINLIHKSFFPSPFKKHYVLSYLILTILLAFFCFKKTKVIYRDTSFSPTQLAFKFLQTNPAKPVFFPMSPLPNVLTQKKIFSAGEALTYSTMMKPDALPPKAGLDFLEKTNLIAFGTPPYSFSYFNNRLNLEKIESPKGLEKWNIYRAKPIF